MATKAGCRYTHGLLIAGTCPWCSVPVVDGVVHPDVAPREAALRRWNVEAMLKALDSPDKETRIWVSRNLMCRGPRDLAVLPVYRKAMHGPDEEVRSLAVSALSCWGRELTHEDCTSLEKEVDKDPADCALRMILLNYYPLPATHSETARKNRYRHILWLIENAPEAAVLGGPLLDLDPSSDGPVHEQAKQLWQRQIEANPENTTILDNAAWALTRSDTAWSEALLKKAQSLQPENPHWSDRLGSLLTFRAKQGDGEDRKATAGQALAEMERAHAQTADELKRLWRLPELARAALDAEQFEKARAYADEMLRIAEQPGYFTYKDGHAVHHGHLVLGRLALRSGDRAKAKLHLLESGKTKGAPDLGSFGPNMMLAKELLECGEREAVIQYLKLCSLFWHTDDHRPEQWIQEIQAGQMPDFGANLVY